MIKYSLVCKAGHDFESWFSDSSGFETQSKRGFVACPICQSTEVTKAIMSPRLGRGKDSADAAPPMQGTAPPAGVPGPAESQKMVLLDERAAALRTMIKELHEKIAATSDNVGSRFPEEARRMHEGDAPERSIYGEATADEARALIEDGIPVMAIPTLPEDRN